MKERPIILTGPEVNAVREGRKTQKRCVVKLVDTLPDGRGLKAIKKPASLTCLPLVDGKFQYSPYGGANYEPYPNVSEFCPFGQPGDRLWVRETWRRWDEEQRIIYKADYQPIEIKMRWKSPACMPKEASRITLEITAVRVERLQEISEEDAKAEGVTVLPSAEIAARVAGDTPARMEFFALWQSIHGPGSWDANPWVFVIEFRKIDG